LHSPIDDCPPCPIFPIPRSRLSRVSTSAKQAGCATRTLAWILAGGNVPHATTLSEDQLLDLEREAFLSLCGEPKTHERIAHTLKTGKTLRN
jgi:hypothetical protein